MFTQCRLLFCTYYIAIAPEYERPIQQFHKMITYCSTHEPGNIFDIGHCVGIRDL